MACLGRKLHSLRFEHGKVSDWVSVYPPACLQSVHVNVRVWVDSRSHRGLLWRRQSGRDWSTSAQARLHAYCLFTWTFHCAQPACKFADNTVLSSEPYTKHCQLHFTELAEFLVEWPQCCHWTDRRIPSSAFSSRHCVVRSCYNAAVSSLHCSYCVIISWSLE